LIFNIIQKPLIFRVFAHEDNSARKYALIFRGISENWDGKIKICFQSESCPYRSLSCTRKQLLSVVLYCFIQSRKILI